MDPMRDAPKVFWQNALLIFPLGSNLNAMLEDKS